MFFCLILAASIGKSSKFQYIHNNILKSIAKLEYNKLDISILGMAAAAGSGFSYPESVANGWDGVCVTGINQSPIDLDSGMKATVHAPINYRNYFNGHFNKVTFIS